MWSDLAKCSRCSFPFNKVDGDHWNHKTGPHATKIFFVFWSYAIALYEEQISLGALFKVTVLKDSSYEVWKYNLTVSSPDPDPSTSHKVIN